MTWRRRIWKQLEETGSSEGRISPINAAVLLAILIAMAAAALETEPALAQSAGWLFVWINAGVVVLFTVEFLARLWTAPEGLPDASATQARWRFLKSPLAVLDLAALVISLLPAGGLYGAAVRVLRLLRVLRIARFGRFSQALVILGQSIASRRYELMVAALLAVGFLSVTSTALYLLEGPIQPDKFGSIPRAMWWSVITLTTVGYGDVYPVTALGKIVASVSALVGIGLVAIPTGIIAAAFTENLKRRQ